MLTGAWLISFGVSVNVPNYLSLEHAWREGLKNSFEVATVRDAVRGADLQVLEALSQFLPKITPSYSHGPNESGSLIHASQTLPYLGGTLIVGTGSKTFGGVGTSPTRTRAKAPTWSQPLLKGTGPNASLCGLRSARRARPAQERNLILVEQRFMVGMARAFHQVLAQRELLKVARQSPVRGAALRNASEARFDVGLSNKLDVYRAQLSESQAEQSTVQAEADDPVEPAPAELGAPDREDPGGIEALVETALAKRVDSAEAREQVQDAHRAASLSGQNLLPNISLNVRFEEERRGEATGPGVTMSRRWESFLSVSAPLQAGADVYRLQGANLQVAASDLERKNQIESEVRSAHRELRSLARSTKTQREAVAIAEPHFQLANLRYQRGLASNFDAVDAEGSLLAARSSLVQLEAAYAAARLQLDRAVGRLKPPVELAP